MCPCPVCATLALLLAPFLGYKWVKNLIKKHHCGCAKCQAADLEKGKSCLCNKDGASCSCDKNADGVVSETVKSDAAVLQKRRAGRPKGAKNKAKASAVTQEVPVTDEQAVKRGPGRPKGARNKVNKTPVSSVSADKKRRPGRPKGAKNKPKKQS